MGRDYAALAKKKIKYSDDIYFLHYGTDFELWLNYEKIASFNNIKSFNEYLFNKYIGAKVARRVYIYVIYFDELYNIFEPHKNEVALRVINKKNNVEITSFQVFGGITYKKAKYYLGTDKIDNIDPKNYCELIEKFHNSLAKHTFTTSLKDIIFTKEIQNFGSRERLPYSVIQELYDYASLAPIIYSDINKEFKNVYCYDFDSAYIAKYFKVKFPVDFQPCSVDSKSASLIRLRIKNIKAKNIRFCCLSLANRDCGTNIIFINKKSKKVLKADEVVISVFWFELEMIEQFYTYDEIIKEKAWSSRFEELPESFKQAVFDIYSTKEEAKHNEQPYADKKVLLNRIHGFFLTSKEYNGKKEPMYPNLPIQIGFFTIAIQRYFMIKLIQQIGLKNIVSAHTDSIKTKGNYDAIVKEWNEKNKNKYSDTLGMLEFEGVMEKVVYFSNTRAKYIMDGEFHIKHGGIWVKDAEDILNTYTYDTFNGNSPYKHTLIKTFSSKGDDNYLNRIQEQRMFSEVDSDEE